MDDNYGTITKNEINGIYGLYNKAIDKNNLIEVGDSTNIKLGKAYFTTVIENDTKETFEINILKHSEIVDLLILNMKELLKELQIQYDKYIKIQGGA